MQRSPRSPLPFVSAVATALGLAAFAPSASVTAQTLTYGNCTLRCPVFAHPDGSTPLLFLAVTTWGNTWTPFADFDDPNAGPFPRVRLKLRTIYSFDSRPCAIGSTAFLNQEDDALIWWKQTEPLTVIDGLGPWDYWMDHEDPNRMESELRYGVSYCVFHECRTSCPRPMGNSAPDFVGIVCEVEIR